MDADGRIRIQEYTTAKGGLSINRQQLLEDLSKYGGTVVGKGKGEFTGGIEVPKGTQIEVISQKTGDMIINQSPYAILQKYTQELQQADLSLDEKVQKLQEFFSSMDDRTDINVPSDIQYVKAIEDGWVDYFWPKELGYQEGTAKGITKEFGLPEFWDRFGSMKGGNFSDIPNSGLYTYSQRSIPYLENPDAYHHGTFNRSTYFDKIDAIANNDLDTLNGLLTSEGIAPLSRDEFVEYFDIYTKYLLDKSNVLGVSPDTIKYGI